MNAALTDLAIKLSKTYDDTDATDILFNKYITSQVRVREQIKEIANLTQHIILETDTEIIAIDKLIGNNTTTLNEFTIKDESSSLDGAIANQYKTLYQEMVFDTISRNLKPIDRPVTLDTDFESGIPINVPLISSPTKESGGLVIYDKANLDTILAREKTLSQRVKIPLSLIGKQVFSRGTRLEFDSTDAKGYLVLTEWEYDKIKDRTTTTGIGEIYFAHFSL